MAPTILASILLLAGCLASQQPPPPVTARQEPTKMPERSPAEGFIPLFDGTSTDAFRGYGKAGFPKQGWVVRDGLLVHEAKAGGGDIITRRQFRNFELDLEWRAAPKANSGIMYRVAETSRPSYYTGPEYQILDDQGLGVAADGKTSSGALYDLKGPAGKRLRPAGEWNRTRIKIVGQHVEHWLNGVKVLEIDFASEDYARRLAGSKFASWEGFGLHRRGHIALQDHGDEVAFRNIWIRELPPEKERLGDEIDLLADSGLDGFTAHLPEGSSLTDVWSIRDGVLVCSGKPNGYLYTRRSFDSFVLRLQWRFDPEKGPGNSGVLLRIQEPHKVWPRCIEAQLQSGRAGDFWNIESFPMMASTARTSGRNTRHSHSNEKEIGQWNEYEIIVDGSWVRLSVNGQVLNEAFDCAELPGPIGLQSEGAEIHFRQLRLTPLR